MKHTYAVVATPATPGVSRRNFIIESTTADRAIKRAKRRVDHPEQWTWRARLAGEDSQP